MAEATPATGTEMPRLEVVVTPTLIITGAIASRDMYAGHHDPAQARRAGMQDVFMNILTTNGLVGRYLTDWSGEEGVIRRVAVNLGLPTYPGDTLVFTGRVRSADDGRDAHVEFEARHERGVHVSGTATLEFQGPNVAEGAQ